MIASHANSRSVCAHTRNLSDDLFRAIRDSGGVVGLNLYTDFLGGADMDAVVRHIEHLLDLGGAETGSRSAVISTVRHARRRRHRHSGLPEALRGARSARL